MNELIQLYNVAVAQGQQAEADEILYEAINRFDQLIGYQTEEQSEAALQS